MTLCTEKLFLFDLHSQNYTVETSNFSLSIRCNFLLGPCDVWCCLLKDT